MNEIDRWIYFDGPEPEHIRQLFDAIRVVPPVTPEDKERRARRFFETLDAYRAQRRAGASSEEQGSESVASEALPSADASCVVPEGGPTAGSPELTIGVDSRPSEDDPVRVV